MLVIFNYDRNYRTNLPSAIALGTFDGIHIGHRRLIEELMLKKSRQGYQTIVYTFLNHPLQVLDPKNEPPRIMLPGEKIRAFSRLGVDILVLNFFDDFLLHQTPREFLDQLYGRIPVKSLVVGFNFRFGYKGAGDRVFLEKEAADRKLELISVHPVELDGCIVSSTLVRNKIVDGRVDEAARMLSQPYSISGRIVHGFGRGKHLGFPTANLRFSPRKVIPKPGVYLTKSVIGCSTYWGITSVGTNPTFSQDCLNIETYLFNCRKNLYGQHMTVYFIEWLRKEIRFNSPDELTRQMEMDRIKAKKLIYKKHRL